MAILGIIKDGKDLEFIYNDKDPVDTKRAFMEAYGFTSEEYDSHNQNYLKAMEELNEKYPSLSGLVLDGENYYYADEDGNPTGKELDMEAISRDIVKMHNDRNPDDKIDIVKS